MKQKIQGLYLVTDRQLSGDRPLEEVVLHGMEGGVSAVQIREKDVTTRFFIEEAKRLKERLASRSVPLLVNDRIDVALAVGADGVHIGQNDMPYPTARRLLGPNAIIGLSVEDMDEVDEAEEFDVDYISVSPVFATPTKTDTRTVWGLEGLAQAKQRSRHPVVAIGGLNASNAADAVRAGADGIAVVSAICAAPDPRQAASDLTGIIQAALRERS